jgi:NTP pyrophosphatase (non-canonical NTP hydrolase)
MSGTAGLGDDVGELLDLLLGAEEGSEATLAELAGTLILGVLEELHDAALVGSKASDLADELADELGAVTDGLSHMSVVSMGFSLILIPLPPPSSSIHPSIRPGPCLPSRLSASG